MKNIKLQKSKFMNVLSFFRNLQIQDRVFVWKIGQNINKFKLRLSFAESQCVFPKKNN